MFLHDGLQKCREILLYTKTVFSNSAAEKLVATRNMSHHEFTMCGNHMGKHARLQSSNLGPCKQQHGTGKICR